MLSGLGIGCSQESYWQRAYFDPVISEGLMSVSQQWVWLHGVWLIAETATCQVTNYCWNSVSQTLSEGGQEQLGCTVLHMALNIHLVR